MFDEGIPSYLEEIYQVLVCAFPDGLQPQEYWPLLALLYQHVGQRNIAIILAEIAKQDRWLVYNDVMGFESDPWPSQEEVEKVKFKLDRCGYQLFVEKDPKWTSDLSLYDEQPTPKTLEFIKCAFPNGLSDEEYLPLLYILREEMTIRATTSFVGSILSKHYLEIYNDALGARTLGARLDPTIIANLKIRLKNCGFEAWLDS